jgi:hypothetical protein
MPKKPRPSSDVSESAQKHKRNKTATQAQDIFNTMVDEIGDIRLIIQQALFRLLGLAWPGAFKTTMIPQPPRVEDAVQRITEGLHRKEFSDQVMNVFYRYLWDACKSIENTNDVLFEKIAHLKAFAQNMNNGTKAESLLDKLDELRFARRQLRELDADLSARVQLSPFQQALLDSASADLNIGAFVRQCLDLALKRDPRCFLVAESCTGFLEAIPVALLGQKLSELADLIRNSHESLARSFGPLIDACEECTSLGG